MKVGIFYSSKYGFTEELAFLMKEAFDDTISMSIDDVSDEVFEQCDRIILGSSVYSGKLRQNMIDFIALNKEVLMSRKVAMYVTSFNDFKTANYLEQSLSKGFINHLTDLKYGGFGYKLDELKMVERLAVKALTRKDDRSDYRNLEGINELIEKMK